MEMVERTHSVWKLRDVGKTKEKRKKKITKVPHPDAAIKMQ